MITPLLIVFLIAVILEVIIQRQKYGYLDSVAKTKVMAANLESLRALSFLPLAKYSEIQEYLSQFSGSLLREGKYTAFTLIQEKKDLAFAVEATRFFKNRVENHSQDSRLTDLEKYLLLKSKENPDKLGVDGGIFVELEGVVQKDNLTLTDEEKGWENAAILPLFYNDLRYGLIIFFSDESEGPSDYEKLFLKISSGILSLALRRLQFNKLLLRSEQLKAVNVRW